MKIDVRLLAIMLLCVFAFSVVGCFLRRDQDEEEPETETAAIVAVNPASGSTIQTNATITLTFDNPPSDVITSVGTVSGGGKNFTITGPFTPGALALTLTWADGQHALNYTVRRVDDKDESEDATASFVSAVPASGSTVPANGSITLTFDNPPGDVTVSAGVVSGGGKNFTIIGPFTPGALRLTITWTGGQQILNYTVLAPDIEAPKITGSTIRDGDNAVDAEAINKDAIIEVTFSEAVTGRITLQTQAGDDAGWTGTTVQGKKATLQLVKGRELTHETAYVIVGEVSDAANNKTNIKIRFVTAAEPDTEVPEIISTIPPGLNRGTPVVDVEAINNAGRIELIYNEEVTGNIKLLNQAGLDVGWIGKVQGKKATLQLVGDRKLSGGATYIIVGKVSDAAGNPSEPVIIFKTTGGPPPLLEGMVLIPKGEFQMGSNDVLIIDGKEISFPAERPVHAVYVDAFYIDVHEVTNAQYKVFIDANPEWQKDKIERRFHDGEYLFDWDRNNHPPGEDDNPVTDVSWYAAMAYAKWAGKRLPTEAEWEKAARGGLRQQKYPWGNAIDPDKANYNKHHKHTTPVGSFPANDYGLHDMAGNVWEWCLDKWSPDFYKDSPDNNPISGGPLMDITNNFTEVITQRVIRGGSYFYGATHARVASRGPEVPLQTTSDIGFRCAFSP